IKKEKEYLDSKLTGFESASKDLDTLLGSQRSDKNNEVFGYSVVPPPAQVYSPPKKDMSWTGLPEFAYDTITDYSRPSSSIEIWETREKLLRPQLVGFGNLNKTLLTKDSRCSRHMTGNISYHSEYKPYDGGYVSFGQGGGKITGKGIDYEELFAPVARIEAIRLFLAYDSFMGFTTPRAWYGTLSKYLLDNGFQRGTIDQTLFIKKHRGDFLLVQVYVDDIIFGSSNPQFCREFEALMHDKFQMSAMDIMFAVCACARHQVTPKECHLHVVKRIFRYLKGHPKLGLWYPKESSFDLVAYSDSDYGGATQDRKSTTGGCQFLGRRLISCNLIMARLAFYDYHNMIAILEKSKHNVDFHQIVDFVEASHIRYAVTIPPTVYVTHIRQFWSTARIETTNEGTKILATVDGKPRTISKSLIRRNLKLNDKEGISSLPDAEIFENLALMGYNILPNQKFTFQKGQFSHQLKFLIHTIMQCLSPKSTGFNDFSSNIATAVVCMATNRVYNFSKMIFDCMVRTVNNKGSKFFMYPRVNCLSFSGQTVSLFDSMLVTQGEGSGTLTNPHHTPSPQEQHSSDHDTLSPSHPTATTKTIPTSTPTKIHTVRQYSRRATQIAQSKALPTTADEHASLLRDDSQGEAFPTISGLDAG
nr:hypothetical protein [Tanacetum cinerariifolium]